MAHYFDSSQKDLKSNTKILTFDFQNHTFTFTTDHGVFSKGKIDTASQILLKNITIDSTARTLLDLGCGYGLFGIVLAKTQTLDVTMTDINERAVALAHLNAKANAVSVDIKQNDGFENFEKRFDLIVSNPPIRIGKNKLYPLFKHAIDHLNPMGELWLVMHKKHGALSALKYLSELSDTHVVAKDKGFHVIMCKKSH